MWSRIEFKDYASLSVATHDWKIRNSALKCVLAWPWKCVYDCIHAYVVMCICAYVKTCAHVYKWEWHRQNQRRRFRVASDCRQDYKNRLIRLIRGLSNSLRSRSTRICSRCLQLTHFISVSFQSWCSSI